MSIERTKLNYFYKGKLPEEQVMVESVFNVPDVEKVLWVEAESVMDNTDATIDSVGISGQVFFSVVYLDTENHIKLFQNNVPFLSKISCKNLTAEDEIAVSAQVQHANYNNKQGKLKCLISLQGNYMSQKSTEILCDGDEQICVKTEEISVQELIKAETIVYTEEISYPITDKMENILTVRSKACIKSIIPDDNLFTITGEIYTTIKYLTTNDEIETIATVNFTEPFKREVEVLGLTPDGVVEGLLCVEQANYKYELDSELNKILISVPLKLLYRACDKLTLPSVVDAYGLDSMLSITTSSFDKSTILQQEFYEVKLEGSVQLDGDAPRIDKIVGFSNPKLTMTSVSYDSSKIYLEGVVLLDISYLNDEMNTIVTTPQQIPFKVSVVTEQTVVDASFVLAELVDVDVASRRGREILVDGKIKAQIYNQNDSTEAVISNLEQGELLPKKQHAIEIYFGKKGDTLWDIAKELKVQPTSIEMQNPEIVLPLEQNENIVIYNSRKQ